MKLLVVVDMQNDFNELLGLCTDICVISNALILKARFPETPVQVNAACCAGVTPDSHRIALAAMKQCQVLSKKEPFDAHLAVYL